MPCRPNEWTKMVFDACVKNNSGIFLKKKKKKRAALEEVKRRVNDKYEGKE